MCEVLDIVENADPCNPNMGGTEDEAYYALLSDFESIPEPPLSNPSVALKFTVTTDPVFKVGKCWRKIQLHKNSGKVSYEGAGNGGAKGALFTFGIPGNNLLGHVLNNLADNHTPYVFLVKRNSTPAGRYDLIGSFKHKAALKGTNDGGTPEGDGDMYNFEVRSTQKFEVHYTGTVQLTEET
ncbi:hypothetical protein GVN20_05630 [Runella sp. CRIBMP]|uniref:hypothetical protein n=1 Tax=Runella sp. CRIBMP TaxID=2683261 RepID=UPI0014125891|nr:hypothetical protein [Runella sp. CRIBMP]NBB18830.1 hypothetical protein [Runella sp. CRIBMP]